MWMYLTGGYTNKSPWNDRHYPLSIKKAYPISKPNAEIGIAPNIGMQNLSGSADKYFTSQ
jgi:hypothetical protein